MADTPPNERPTAGVEAVIVEWDTARGYGFADDGRRRIFVHVRDFSRRPSTVEVGTKIRFVLGTDKQGRTCAQQVEMVRASGRFRWSALIWAAGLLSLPTVLVVTSVPVAQARILGIWGAVASALTFGLYWNDKRRAQRSDWRTPESSLHLIELAGGWPGGLLARAWLRHKSSKLSFRVKSWLIIGVYQIVSADALLGWPMLRAVWPGGLNGVMG